VFRFLFRFSDNHFEPAFPQRVEKFAADNHSANFEKTEFSLIKVERKRVDKKLSNKIVHAEIHDYDNQLEIRKLWSQLDSCKSKSTNFAEYTNEAKKLGIKVKIRYRDEKPYGISYSRYLEKTIKSNRNDNADQETESKFIIRGQKLGRGYMISGLKQTFAENQKNEVSFTMKTENLEEKVSGLIMQSSSIPQLTMSLNQASIHIVNKSQNNPVFIQDDQTIRLNQLNQQTQMHLDFLMQLNLQEAREKKEQERKELEQKWFKENYDREFRHFDQSNSESKGFKM